MLEIMYICCCCGVLQDCVSCMLHVVRYMLFVVCFVEAVVSDRLAVLAASRGVCKGWWQQVTARPPSPVFCTVVALS